MAPKYMLDVLLKDGKNLLAADVGGEKHTTMGRKLRKNPFSSEISGTSDPYCKMYLQSRSDTKQKSEIKMKTLNPVWNQSFYWQNISSEDVLKVEVFDYDRVQSLKVPFSWELNTFKFTGWKTRQTRCWAYQNS